MDNVASNFDISLKQTSVFGFVNIGQRHLVRTQFAR